MCPKPTTLQRNGLAKALVWTNHLSPQSPRPCKYTSTPVPSSPVQKPVFVSPSKRTYARDITAKIPITTPATPVNTGVPQEQGAGVLNGKTILITGASRGIGAEIAKRFAREGGRCILIGRDEVALQKVREDMKPVLREDDDDDGEKSGHEHVVLVGDVGKEEFWQGDSMKDVKKDIDILVNAAGIAHYSPLFITKPSLVQEVINTNLNGTISACTTIGKAMMRRKEGCIINVASLLGHKGGKGSVAYAASKAGVIGLTRALAAEIGERNIRVNVIIPGYIETDMTKGMTVEARQDALNAIPLKRFGEPSEIADAAVFLATNKYANNCVLNLDGGLSAT